MSTYKYLKYFPKPFLEDLVKGRCIPFIGAGFSKNAELPPNKKMLDWDELGRFLAQSLPDYQYVSPLDAISAYAYEYKMAKLIEQLDELLLVNIAKPSAVYRSFCQLPFDLVCTTNLEFLIERGYESVHRYCCPVIEESQLAVDNSSGGVCLLKLHGDLHHLNRIVATEEAYDGFIEQYPLLATFLGNLFISKTALFIGYSLDDPDIRHIWHIIGERLGKLRRLAYTISIDAPTHYIARFERRGVKVINLPGKKEDYTTILEAVFNELGDYWSKTLIETSTVTEEESMAELSLPVEAESRLCFFAIPFRLLSYYKSKIFPIVEKFGFTPITAEDVLSPGDNITAKISAIMDRTKLIVADITAQSVVSEVGIALSKNIKGRRILIIREEDTLVPIDLLDYITVVRPTQPQFEDNNYIKFIVEWFKNQSEQLRPVFENEPRRLVEKGEHRAAVITAFTLLENQLRIYFEKQQPDYKIRSLRVLLNKGFEVGIIQEELLPSLNEWLSVRNRLVHTVDKISAKMSNRIVTTIYDVVKKIPID